MAKRRGPDGMPIDVPTRPPPASPLRQAQGDVPTMPPSAGKAGSLFPDEPPTRPPARPRSDSPAPPPQKAAEPHTRIYGGQRPAVAPSPSPAVKDAMTDPIAGWLVIVDGPGKGHHVAVGYGQNSIGRGGDVRIRLDFGDDEISRGNHGIITFDPRGKVFYVQQGTGTNLIYLDNTPVLTPRVLPDRAELLIGSTKLRFVAFCGPDFSWA